jgi:hypothetical protein
MSYLIKFKGTFKYSNVETAENALKAIDIEAENPDDFEMNALEKEDFKLNSETASLSINFSNFLAASSWYGCLRVLREIAKKAKSGKIKCSFEGDADEWVKAGKG